MIALLFCLKIRIAEADYQNVLTQTHVLNDFFFSEVRSQMLFNTYVICQIKFEGMWSELEAKTYFLSESFTKYLR